MSRGDALDRLRQALEDHGCQVRGDSAQCPAHEDTRPSLSVSQGKTGAVLHCHAGCDTDAVLEALGMSATDLFDEPRSSSPSEPEVIATYTYTDEHGTPLFYVERRAGKRFRQYRLDAAGRKVWNLDGVRRVPYRLPELLGAVWSAETVYVCEGEKDVHGIEAAGGVATCNPGGAGKWRAEYAGHFADIAKVIVVADRDEPGRAHAVQVAGSLRSVVAEVEVVEAAEGKDAADHLAAGFGLGDFRPAVAQAAPPEPAAAPGPHVIVLADVQPERVEWLWPGYLPRGKLVILDGDPGQGKSVVSVDLAARVSTGSVMPDGAEPVKGAVLILSAEDGLADTIRPRLDAADGDAAQVVTITEMPEVTEDGKVGTRPVVLPGDLAAIEKVITGHGVVLVIVDVLMAYLSGTVNAHHDQDIRRALHPLAAMAERTGCCVLVIRHLNKNSGTHAVYRGGGSIGIVGAARAGFMCGTDPDDETGITRVFAPVKVNLARQPPALAYRLEENQSKCVRVAWLGESRQTAGSLLAEHATDEERTERTEAGEWLKAYLTDSQRGGEDKAGDIIKAAEKDGIGRYALHRAKRRAGVITVKSSMRGGWMWRLDTAGSDTKVAKVSEIPPSQSRPPSQPSDGQSAEDGEPRPDDSTKVAKVAEIARRQSPSPSQPSDGQSAPRDSEDGEPWPDDSNGEQAQQPPTEGTKL